VIAVRPESPFFGLPEMEIQGAIERIKQQRQQLEQKNQALMADSQAIAEKLYQQGNLQKNVDAVDQDIRETENSVWVGDELIEVSSEGLYPMEPFKDDRLKRLGMGAAAGLCFSFGLFFLWGTLDRRAYGSKQLGVGAMPSCLGVLPDLGRSMRDPESSDIASHCVHQIRNQIEAVRKPGSGYVLAFTSPFQGDGKTSVVMALSWSYAAAGYRTIVVDCDMVGRSLTRQLGLIGREGLKEVLRAQAVNGEITRLPVEHLSAIPVGADPHIGPEAVRRIDLDRLFKLLRKDYEMILVDTGPLLGALESTPVAAAADSVVMTVRRGRSRTRLEECVTRLQQVGANCLGVILNCANRNECERYVSEASLAAAEEGRSGQRGSRTAAIVRRPSAGERNALVRAMEDTARAREEND